MSTETSTETKSSQNSAQQSGETKAEQGAVSGKQVADFLGKNPDWLYENDALMQTINLRAEFHGATSLLEHQAQTLRKTNNDYKQKLSELIANSENNQNLVESLFLFCDQLLKAGTADDIYNILQHALPDLFDVESVKLILHNPTTSGSFRIVIMNDIAKEKTEPGYKLLKLSKPRCIQPDQAEALFLFGAQGKKIRSIALLPLHLDSQPHAMCCLGSEDAQRYRPDKDTVILSYICKLTSAAIKRACL